MADTGLPALRSRRGLWLAEIIGLGVIAAIVVVAVASSRPSGPPDIAVADVWARATPAGAPTAAVYLTIRNDGGDADRLVSATTPVAGTVMIHRTAIANDIATMADMEDGMPVPGGEATIFAPNGNHLMLMDLPAPLTEGETFPMTLTFATTGTVTAEVRVLGVAAAGPAPGDQ
ncbi:MAG: copper chaperone PCu(A)C [Bauldia sp.]